MQSELRGRRLASQLIAQTPTDQCFDARSIVRAHPELQHDRSALLELAFEEYCRRCDAGEMVRGTEFAARFSLVQRSLQRLIEVDGYLKENSVLAENLQQGLWPDVGETFLGFDLIEELGRGALSRVFLARESQIGSRQVVAKVCLRGAHEAWTLGRLDHPGVVPVFSIQHDELTGLSAICMPYLSRATLFDVIECLFPQPGERPLRGGDVLRAVHSINAANEARSLRPRSRLSSARYTDAAIDIGIQLAEALAYTHEKGVLHCDIKPTNVLLSNSGQAMLLDFNLSVDESAANSAPGGTLPYMAPELLRLLTTCPSLLKNGPQVDPRVDVYSLGVTLYELLSGQLPFPPDPNLKSRGEMAAALLDQQERQSCPPLETVNPQVDERLARIVSSCFALDPAKRPESAETLVRQLRRYRTVRSRISRFSRRHVRVLLGMTMVVSVCGGLFITSERGRRGLVELGLLTESPDARAERLLSDAWMSLEESEYAQARDGFSQVLELQPLNDTARFGRGRAYLGLEELELAADDFQDILTRGSSGIVHANLAYCLGLQRNYLDAAIQCEYAEYYGYLNRIVATNWAECFLRIGGGDYQQAVHLTRFINPKTCGWEELYLLGRVQLRLINARRTDALLRRKEVADELVRRRLDPAKAVEDPQYLKLTALYDQALEDGKSYFDRLIRLPDTHPNALVTAAGFYFLENPAIGTDQFKKCADCICLAAERGARHSYLRSTVSTYSKLYADPRIQKSLDDRRDQLKDTPPIAPLRDPLKLDDWPLSRISQLLAIRGAVIAE